MDRMKIFYEDGTYTYPKYLGYLNKDEIYTKSLNRGVYLIFNDEDVPVYYVYQEELELYKLIRKNSNNEFDLEFIGYTTDGIIREDNTRRPIPV